MLAKRTRKQRAAAAAKRSPAKPRKFRPATAADVTDERLVAGQLRTLQRDVKAGFDRMDVRFETILEKILVVVDDLSHRVTSLERRMSTLEDARAKTP